MQLAAYVGAVNADPNYARLGPIKKAAVVLMYESKRPAEIRIFRRRRATEALERVARRLPQVLLHNEDFRRQIREHGGLRLQPGAEGFGYEEDFRDS
ncbi:hypothetical protein L596_013096 [Steinernema carpocapsae]|uniref:Uncharacterized protein n=1 Tax=Steinernema carpocapsae TaxID=34508 RepID=A0A4U5NZ74_STECR|nr:hypothetical protein L596_013096 [Steinernema carpocapsae]